MSDLFQQQQAIWARCFHPSGTFVQFEKDEVEQSIPERFEQQVRKFPEQVAVKTRARSLTYSQLNQAANQVAHAILTKRGPKPEPVTLFFEHGDQMIAAILGVLKAGKSYVPLDPAYPRNRLDYILQDSQADVLLTNGRNRGLAEQLSAGTLEMIDMDDAGGLATENPSVSIPPEIPAFILYTSGSTGQPKGVTQNHRNVLHETMNYTNIFHTCAADRLTLLESYSFGGAVRNIFGALLNGATLCPFDVKLEGLKALADWLDYEQITIYRSVETLFYHFASTLVGTEQFPETRVVWLGGEPVYKRDVDLYKKHFSPTCIFINGLGSTESLTFRCYFVDKETRIDGHNVPVGYPLQDMETMLLNEDGEVVEPNEIGEMAVKSRFLSPGYWLQPELTRARFLPSPDCDEEPIYLTGDMGVMGDDGLLVHLGRKDFQVKIRGYRVEVAEVEMTLMEQAGIKEAAVVAQEDAHGDQQLVAYVVAAAGFSPTITEMRLLLAARLPAYMVPALFVFMDALPLLPTGKLDRRALPKPGRVRPELDIPYQAPGNSVEEKLVQIWREVLNLDRVGIHDDFLELGGDSLLAASVFARMEETFGKKVPLSVLVNASTVAQLATLLSQEEDPATWSSLVPIQPQGSRPPFFCVHGAGGHVLGFSWLAQYLGPEQPFYGLEAPGRDGEREPLESIADLATHYIQEIRAVQPEGPYYLGGLCMGGNVALEMAQQLREQAQEVALLAMLDTPAPVARNVITRVSRRWQRVAYRVRGLARHWRNLKQRPRGELPGYIIEKARVVQKLLTPDTGVRRANHRASQSYVARTYSGRIALFLAQDEPVMELPDPRLRWAEVATGEVEVYEVPGNQNGMLREPQVAVLGERLKECLSGEPAANVPARS